MVEAVMETGVELEENMVEELVAKTGGLALVEELEEEIVEEE